jgi:hypothetical protein
MSPEQRPHRCARAGLGQQVILRSREHIAPRLECYSPGPLVWSCALQVRARPRIARGLSSLGRSVKDEQAYRTGFLTRETAQAVIGGREGGHDHD